MSDPRSSSLDSSESALAELLRSVRWVKVCLETSSTSLLAFACLLGAAFVAVLTDAVLALPIAARIAVNLLLGAGVLWALGLIVRGFVLNRFEPRRLARLVEDRLGLEDSVFINGVEFAGTEPGTSSPALRARAIRMAQERARDVSTFDVVPMRSLNRPAITAGAAVLVLIVAWLAAPRLFAAVIPRYVDPDGDHPPYTLVTFDVEVSPQPVLHGRPAKIAAVLGGPEVIDQASLVFLGQLQESLPMSRMDERQFTLHIERPVQSRKFYIDTPRGRSRTMTLDVLEVPWFEEARVGYAYPGYTGWPPAEQPLTDRGIHALAGTEVTLKVRSNLPLQAGRLRLMRDGATSDQDDPAPVMLHPDSEDARTVTGSFAVDFSGRFELTLVGANGAESVENLEGPLVAVPDRAPHVAIIEPAQRVLAVEDWRVPVTVEALDDIGISRMRLHRSVNGWGPTPVELSWEAKRSNGAVATAEFDLAALGSRAGDVITYYASTFDNHPSGKQFAESELCVIQIISKREYEQFARQQYQMDEMIAEFEAIREELDRLRTKRNELLEELETLQKQLEAADQPPDELLKKMEELQEQLGEYSKSSEELAQRLQKRTEQMQLYELEEPYTEKLKELGKQLQDQSQNAAEVQQQMEKLKSDPGSESSRQALKDAAEKFQQENQPFDESSQQQLDQTESDLELYRMADAMVAAAERMRSVIARQREIADRLGEFRNSDSISAAEQARADRLATEQELLEQELQDAAKAMEQAAHEAQERLPQMAADAQKLCQAIGELGIPEDQRIAAQQARRGAGQQAHEAADEAARDLESLLSQCADCQGAGNCMSDSLDGPLQLPSDRLQECLNQLAQGRKIPGVGSRPGSGKGRGRSGQGANGEAGTSGEGSGEAAGGMWRPGQTLSGSQAPLTVLGPHTPQSSQQQQAGGIGDGRGGWLPVGGDDARAAESLNAAAREGSRSGVGNLRGVPAGYRDAAEAYFRRLAEEK